MAKEQKRIKKSQMATAPGEASLTLEKLIEDLKTRNSHYYKRNRVKDSQLLHLSARTRYRCSLRFQVSYLTLLFRRTNRFGPVDFLPRIFAEVAAHRHKVMPHSN